MLKSKMQVLFSIIILLIIQNINAKEIDKRITSEFIFCVCNELIYLTRTKYDK